jgi:hypothetical protein
MNLEFLNKALAAKKVIVLSRVFAHAYDIVNLGVCKRALPKSHVESSRYRGIIP